MSLSLVKFHPSMDLVALIAALNENFSLLENLNQTTVYKDESGDNRIVIGKFPDGTWGIIMVKAGEDALSVLE